MASQFAKAVPKTLRLLFYLMTEGTLKQISEFTADVLGLPVDQITADSGPATLDVWDSVQHLNLILAIEQHYGFQFEPEELEGTKNVAAIAAVVDRKLGSS